MGTRGSSRAPPRPARGCCVPCLRRDADDRHAAPPGRYREHCPHPGGRHAAPAAAAGDAAAHQGGRVQLRCGRVSCPAQGPVGRRARSRERRLRRGRVRCDPTQRVGPCHGGTHRRGRAAGGADEPPGAHRHADPAVLERGDGGHAARRAVQARGRPDRAAAPRPRGAVSPTAARRWHGSRRHPGHLSVLLLRGRAPLLPRGEGFGRTGAGARRGWGICDRRREPCVHPPPPQASFWLC